eukprot:272789-Chlamydomonas_euryale.AAC.1
MSSSSRSRQCAAHGSNFPALAALAALSVMSALTLLTPTFSTISNVRSNRYWAVLTLPSQLMEPKYIAPDGVIPVKPNSGVRITLVQPSDPIAMPNTSISCVTPLSSTCFLVMTARTFSSSGLPPASSPT